MDYESQLRAFDKYAPAAASRLVEENSELFLSIDEGDVMRQAAATMRLRWEEIPTPSSEEEMLAVLLVIVGDLLRENKIKVKEYGLSNLGREEWNNLVSPPVPSTEPEDRFRDVIALYRGNVAEFNARRASDADFLRRSNEANQLGILR